MVACPDIIEPLLHLSRFSPTGKWAFREFGEIVGILGNGTKPGGMEQRHFTE